MFFTYIIYSLSVQVVDTFGVLFAVASKLLWSSHVFLCLQIWSINIDVFFHDTTYNYYYSIQNLNRFFLKKGQWENEIVKKNCLDLGHCTILNRVSFKNQYGYHYRLLNWIGLYYYYHHYYYLVISVFVVFGTNLSINMIIVILSVFIITLFIAIQYI